MCFVSEFKQINYTASYLSTSSFLFLYFIQLLYYICLFKLYFFFFLGVNKGYKKVVEFFFFFCCCRPIGCGLTTDQSQAVIVNKVCPLNTCHSAVPRRWDSSRWSGSKLLHNKDSFWSILRLTDWLIDWLTDVTMAPLFIQSGVDYAKTLLPETLVRSVHF